MLSLRIVVAAAALGACSFNPPAAIDAPPADPVDAPAEALLTCTPGEAFCGDRDLEVCNAEGSGPDPALTQRCGLGCVDKACVEASNIPLAMQTSCTAGARKLEPPAGATVSIMASQITCSPSCDAAPENTSIQPVGTFPQAGGPMLAVYCLSGVTIPAGVIVSVEPGVATAIGWLVAGNVQLAGELHVTGRNATDVAGGTAGPSGGAGGGLAANDNAGLPGLPTGSCGGDGGGRAGATGVGGGGGGGGHARDGGDGGRGRDVISTAGGGDGGEVCGVESLAPIAGGGGGGGGGDGACGELCGWGGGGGGGAIQISATGTISIPASGSIRAGGGNGFGSASGGARTGGGGGGGAGGAVLLETPSLQITGAIRVTGGAGGQSGAGQGGSGASGATLTGGNGANEDDETEGGAGGGGAAGWVRVNAVGAACPATVEPTGACSMGSLRPTVAPTPLP